MKALWRLERAWTLAGRYAQDPIQRAHHALRWHILSNPAARRLFESRRPGLTNGQQRVVEDLKRDGVSIIHFNEFVGDPNRWEELSEVILAFEKSEMVQAGVSAYRQSRKTEGWDAKKQYLVRAYPDGVDLSPDDPWLRMGTSPVMLDIVNSYLGLWSRLVYLNLWYTIPMGDSRHTVSSQRWHRDPEDTKMLKAFLYFSDVDEGAGPLQYIPGTTADGQHRTFAWRSSPAEPSYPSVYPAPEAVERRFPSTQWVTCTGPAGTMVFCDTRGLHRGGFATRRHRLFATWAYVTPASLDRRRFVLRDGLAAPQLSEEAVFALS